MTYHDFWGRWEKEEEEKTRRKGGVMNGTGIVSSDTFDLQNVASRVINHRAGLPSVGRYKFTMIGS